MTRTYPHNTDPKPKVAVYDRRGNILGYVSWNATSVGASKVAGRSCQYSRRFGSYAWVADDETAK